MGTLPSRTRSPIELFLEAKRPRKTNRGTDPVRVECPGTRTNKFMIIKLLLVVPLLTIIFYTLVGIMKREVWIVGSVGRALHATKEKGWKALFFGTAFSIIYIFVLLVLVSEMQPPLDYSDWVVSVILAVLCTWPIVFLGKRSVKDPFKVVVPVLGAITLVSGLVALYFVIMSVIG